MNMLIRAINRPPDKYSGMRWTSIASVLAAAVATSICGAGASAAEVTASSGACTQTTRAAYKACKYDVQDNFWTQTGVCINDSNAEARTNCKTEAVDESRENGELCDEQQTARFAVCAAIGESRYDPVLDPARFVDPAQIGHSIAANPYFPLNRGRVWIYEGAGERNIVTVTTEIRNILGITCAVIHDVVEEDGEVTEDTKDWYAQDVDGNVWYFGEISQQREDGELVSIDGSWLAGVDGAKPGLIMKAIPAVGDVYRQEFALGEAEDMAEILRLGATASVPAASCTGNCLLTKDYSALEPDVVERKYYAPGIGLILEVDPKTGERTELVSMHN